MITLNKEHRTEWLTTKLGECFKLMSGTNLTSKMMVADGKYPVYGGNGVAGVHDDYNLSGSNVIIGRVGALCGKARHIQDKIWITDNAFKLTGFKYEFDHAFLTYLLNYKELRKYARQAAQPVISNSSLEDITLEFPNTIGEQKRIVVILDEAFSGIARAKEIAEKNLANAREIFSSYLQSLFANPGSPWEPKNISDISIEFGRGKSRHRPRGDTKILGGSYPLIQTGDVGNSSHWIRTYTQTYNEMGLAQSKLWPRGTVCIAIVGANVGETAILDFDSCFPDSVIGIIVDEKKANNEYVEYLLQSYKTFLKECGKGTARDNINMATFENQNFPFPPLKVQIETVSRLNRLAVETKNLESIYNQKLSELEDLKKSFLSKAFNGEL